MLTGTITALVTPMHLDGSIDYPSLAKLIEFQIEHDVSGIVIAGSTGESMTLTHNEKIELIKYSINQVDSRVKVIVGMAHTATADAISYTHQLNDISGIDYVMVLTPSYIKPTQEGMYQHFKQIAALSQKPIILYNVPGRTGIDLSDETILRLANDCPNIAGLKDATGDVARCNYLVTYKPEHFALYSGDDCTALPFILCGGNGVISVMSNLLPRQMSQMVTKALADNVEAAKELNHTLLELYEGLFVESNPIPVKWMLYHKNIISSPYLRLPLTLLSEKLQEKLKPVLTQVNDGIIYAQG